MNSRKVLKGRNASNLLSIYDGKGEHPEEEVMQLVEVTTRWHEGSSQDTLIVSESRKGPSA